jgi:hypothetical protein
MILMDRSYYYLCKVLFFYHYFERFHVKMVTKPGRSRVALGSHEAQGQ